MATRHVRGSAVYVDSTGVGSSYVQVGCVFAMSMPPLMRGTADVTCMDVVDPNDPDNFYRKFIKGFKDSGEPTFKFRFDLSEYSFMKGIYEDDSCDRMPKWKFDFGICPDDANIPEFIFSAIITKLDMPEKSIDGDNTWECNVTLKISGSSSFGVA